MFDQCMNKWVNLGMLDDIVGQIWIMSNDVFDYAVYIDEMIN